MRRKYLIISLLFFLLGFILILTCLGKERFAYISLSPYLSSARSLGYRDFTPSVKIELGIVSSFELRLSYFYSSNRKTYSPDEGHCEGWDFGAGVPVVGKIFLFSGPLHRFYQCEQWSKSFYALYILTRYGNFDGPYQVSLWYIPRENQTNNRTEHAGLSFVQILFNKKLWSFQIFNSIQITWADNLKNGEREAGLRWDLGINLVFKIRGDLK